MFLCLLSDPGVLHLLDFVAHSPHYNWRYKSQHLPKGPTTLQPSIIMNTMNNTVPVSPQVSLDPAPMATTPLDHNNKVLLTAHRMAAPPSAAAPAAKVVAPVNSQQDSIELEPFYYGQIQGDATLGREINTTRFVCHICSVVCENNIDFYSHLKLHLSRTAPYGDTKMCCDYCTDHFTNDEKKIFHQRVKHMHTDSRFIWCRICTVGFSNEFNLVNHMAKKHYESELPYRCDVCYFVTSIFYSLIDHFNTEHKNTSYVQCHFCLVVKSISPATSNSFSQRMYQHLQRHTHQQARCKQCQLNFYSAFLRDDHKKKDHVTRVGFPGLQRYKIPSGQNRIVFRPWIKRQVNSVNPASNSMDIGPPMALSSTLEWHSFTLNDTSDHKCLECGSNFSLSHHFKYVVAITVIVISYYFIYISIYYCYCLFLHY
ncbi:Zinc finger protein 280D [Chionoecetes opilio]|uniref:Zinc finger protein 280D n=1 Tax=Chionoecetes opilio TaxID=41210 RepID=A0A8J4YF92_CHIOP|nr:Zinc finger protein 280D [Chionoecetes opilio]